MSSYAEINLKAFSHNLRFIRNILKPSTQIMAVLKANAYGHGSIMIARQAEADGVEMIGTANLFEAIELRDAGVKVPLLILSGIMEDQIKTYLDYDFSTVIYSKEAAAFLYAAAKKKNKRIKVHLKADTGMGRLGFKPEEIYSFMNQYRGKKFFIFEGLMTHLASAFRKNEKLFTPFKKNTHEAGGKVNPIKDMSISDNHSMISHISDSVEKSDSLTGFTHLQIESFNVLIENLRASGISFPVIHCANSAGIIDFPESHFNMVRPGIVLYGISPFDEKRNDLDIQPVLSWKTRIIQLSHMSKEKPISYGGTFITKRDSVIATIPVGYADGYHRLLSNKVFVLVKGNLAPQVGRICMDLTMIDVTGIPGISVGDEVVLIGVQGKKKIQATDLSGKIGTIPYEILCGIGNRTTRIPS